MFRGLMDLFNVLMLWSFAYVASIMLLIVAVTYITKHNPQPIIHQHNTTHQQTFIKVIEPINTDKNICNRIDGCPIVNNVCIDCE